jgi:hypothetical protein
MRAMNKSLVNSLGISGVVPANASELSETEEIIYIQEGMIPNLVIAGPGIQPVIDTTNQPTELS